mmetsp:Transcript_78372/g.199217  ORF Transcript_78372/g.199217 Transcript_78372/m.199217 type:complete len:191 (+) Transcript_78372:76-648(+)
MASLVHGMQGPRLAPVLGGLRRSLVTSALRLPPNFAYFFMGTSRPNKPPLLPEGMDPRERHHCGEKKYIGKTPREIVARFKNEATFPWYLVPESHRDKRFEELYQMAKQANHKDAVKTVGVLTNAAHDRGKLQIKTGQPQRLGRSAKRALQSGVEAQALIHANGPSIPHRQMPNDGRFGGKLASSSGPRR